MAWHAVSVPSSSRNLLPPGDKNPFSPVQKIRAAVHYYCGLPLRYRVQLARQYAAQARAKE